MLENGIKIASITNIEIIKYTLDVSHIQNFSVLLPRIYGNLFFFVCMCVTSYSNVC